MPISPLSPTKLFLLPVLSLGAGLLGALPITAMSEENPATVNSTTTDSTTMDEIKVNTKPVGDYRTTRVKIGPLNEKPLLDTPYSIDVVPAELMRNQQLKSVREAFRYLPSVQGENIRPQSRGLQAGVVQNTRIDGLNIASTTDYPIEQFERIEVLNSLSGAIYGPANPAGTFNYVSKRPTDERLMRFGVGYANQSSTLGSVDLGGHLDEAKRFGYRLNLLDDRGEGYVDRSRLERKLASLAVDVRLSDTTMLETNASRYHYISKGFPGTFSLSSGVNFPSSIPDPKRLGYGQPFGGDDNVTETFSGRIKHSFNPDWQLSAGLLHQDSDRASTAPTNLLTNNAGSYQTRVTTTTFSLDTILSNTIALNGRFKTGGLTHDLVVSNTGFTWDRYTPNQTGGILLGTASLNNPVVFNEPVFPDFKSRYQSLTTRQQSITVGDTITWNEKWSASLIASQSWINVSNYSKTGLTTSQYDDDGISTNATLAYKPLSNMTFYGSYADSLQQGDIATSGINVGTGLPAYRSKQWELGYKAGWARLNITAALFRVERPYAYLTSSNIFQVEGEQVNNGLELTANGSITRDLSLYSGITYLDPRVDNTGNIATSGKQILGLSRAVGSVLLDYRIPAIPGLAVNMRIAYASKRPGDFANSYWVDGFTTTDIGARYNSQIMGKTASWNLAINNIANERYWANITPSSQNGYSGSGTPAVGTGTLGAPRTLRASLQVDF